MDMSIYRLTLTKRRGGGIEANFGQHKKYTFFSNVYFLFCKRCSDKQNITDQFFVKVFKNFVVVQMDIIDVQKLLRMLLFQLIIFTGSSWIQFGVFQTIFYAALHCYNTALKQCRLYGTEPPCHYVSCSVRVKRLTRQTFGIS